MSLNRRLAQVRIVDGRLVEQITNFTSPLPDTTFQIPAPEQPALNDEASGTRMPQTSTATSVPRKLQSRIREAKADAYDKLLQQWQAH